jgi:hypothetical protein
MNAGSADFSVAVQVYSLRPLVAVPDELSASAGIVVPFGITGGVAAAGWEYILLVGFTGTAPGFGVDGVHVPLNVDALTSLGLMNLNQPQFVGFAGTLDATTGRASATLDLTAITLPPSAIGLRLSFAWVARAPTPAGGPPPPWLLGSNPQSVLIVP